jgi:hypothetical protein
MIIPENADSGRPASLRLLPLRAPGTVVLAFVLFLGLGVSNRVMAQSESGIKAAFLYNFAKFTEWPAGAFASPAAPINVGFIGAGALAETFEQNTRGKNANGRDFVVKKLNGAAGAEDCQIVYVAEAGQVGAVTAALKGKPVLIVGEPSSLLDHGGMIRFVADGAKIVFDVNLTSVNGAGLKLDPKLSKIARNIKGG